jgi:hypothetical protein
MTLAKRISPYPLDGLVMRRTFAVLCTLGVIALGLGCSHIGGKSDCYHHPDNAEIGVGHQPYATLGSPISGTATPEKLAAPADKPAK